MNTKQQIAELVFGNLLWIHRHNFVFFNSWHLFAIFALFTVYISLLFHGTLTLSCIMLQNGQTYFKCLTVWTPQDFWRMFGYFTTLCMKGIKNNGLLSAVTFIYQLQPSSGTCSSPRAEKYQIEQFNPH